MKNDLTFTGLRQFALPLLLLSHGSCRPMNIAYDWAIIPVEFGTTLHGTDTGE